MRVELKENLTGKQTPFKTVLDYGVENQELYFNFCCENSQLYSAGDTDNSPIYRGDVCEVFLCVGENRNEYFEIEVAPNGVTFFALIKNKNGVLDTTFLEKNFMTFVTVTDKGYDVEIIIPFKALGITNRPIYFNAYRIETEGGIEDANLLALNPTGVPRFHCPEKFIELERKIKTV
jgi:hypothetical protein